MDITKLRTAIKVRWASVDIQFVGLKARDLALTLAVDEFINAAQESGTNAAHASNTASLQLLLESFKREYPSLSSRTIHAVNAFVLYAQQQQA